MEFSDKPLIPIPIIIPKHYLLAQGSMLAFSPFVSKCYDPTAINMVENSCILDMERDWECHGLDAFI